MMRRFFLLAWFSASLLLSGPAAQAYDKARPPQAAAGRDLPATAMAAPAVKPVDINNASRAELKALPGIGDVEADRIIAARPYPSKAKLVADKVLPDDKYLALRGRIVAGQPATSKPQPASAALGKAPAKP